MIRIYFLFLLILTYSELLIAQDDTVKWVASWGDDINGNGKSNSPYKTIQKALSELDSGTILFRITENIDTFREEVIIDGKQNITIRGHGPGNQFIIFDGTSDLSDFIWTDQGNNIFKTTIDTIIWQLFLDGEEMVMARWPNAQFTDKSIYSWDTWAQGDESLSSNGTVVVDSEFHDMSTLSGALDTAHAILNLGSFRTWNSKIDHTQENSFTYDRSIPDAQYKDKHHYFFVEGDFDLLDTINEWYHNPQTGELWVMTDGTNPNELEVKGKTSTYSINIKNSNNITIENLFFFSSTIKVASSENIIIQDCNFAFPSTSKRMIGDLGTPDATTIGISGASNKVNNSIFRRNLFSYTDGDAIRVYGDNNRIENNIFQYIDYSVSELPGLMVSFYINGDKNIFTKNSINNVQASATLTPGERSEFSYNKVTKTGALQSDGSVFQGTRNYVADSKVHHNYIYNTPKLALRYDAPGDDPLAAGQRGKMYNNVAINTSGIMVKGDYHYIANNTVIGSYKNGMIILDEENSNSNTYTRNNLVDKLSGHRSISNYEDKDGDGFPDYPIPGTSSNNWNGWDSVKTNYNDELSIDNTIYSLIDSLTLMPLEGSPLIDGGKFIDSIPQEVVGTSPDIGAYEYGGELWKAGVEGWFARHYPWSFMKNIPETILKSSNSNLYEDSTIIEITVKLINGAHNEDIIINIDTINKIGFANYGRDWIIIYNNDTIYNPNKDLIWLKGEDSITLNIHPVSDNIYEKDESLIAGISGISAISRVIPLSTGIYGTLYDDDPMPTASASFSIDSISENSETKNIKLMLSNPSKFDIKLGLSVEDSPFVPEDLAKNKKDFLLDVDTLVFPALSTEQEFNITSIQDDEIEGNELAVINIESEKDSIYLSVSVVIIDDEQKLPSVNLSVSPSEIFEDGGITTVSASLSATYNKNVTVNLSISGTASGDSTDYILDSQTIIILAGDTIGSTTISAVQDADDEGNETIILDIKSVTNGTENGVQQKIITIIDDDNNTPIPTVTLLVSPDTIPEFDGLSTIYAILSSVSDENVTVSLSSSGTAAGEGVDYKLSSKIITINAGDSSGTSTVSTVKDNIEENDETIILDIISVINGNENGIQQKYITIIDDDKPLPLQIENKRILERIFPNPANNKIRINSNKTLNIKNITFIDFEGKIFKPKNVYINSSFTDIDISNLKNGIYILNIELDKEVLKVKIVIDR